MSRLILRMGFAVAALAAVGVLFDASCWAQQPQRVRLRGTIEKVDGNTLVVTSVDGVRMTVNLTTDAKIVAVIKATLADIKAGSYVGSTAMPQADGSQKALEVHIFDESMRGIGEGHRPFTTPINSTMTNGTVGDMVTAASGGTLTVRYKDGEKKIVVSPDVPIVRYEVTDRRELKPGVHIAGLNALKKADGTFEAARLNVGRDGLEPR